MITVGLIAVAPMQLMSLAAMTVLQTANSLTPEPAYRIALLSEEGGLVTTAAGFGVDTVPIGDARFDTLLVSAFVGTAVPSQALVASVRHLAADARRVGSFCTGAFVLAAAGLLDGRRATTHWRHLAELQRAFPRVRLLRDRLYVEDGSFWTAAGMTAGIDMMLALVEADLGEDIAREVAERMVMERRRPGGGAQVSGLLTLVPKTDRIETVLAFAKKNLKEPLTVGQLAEVAHLSPRQFSRAFNAATGESPAKVVERLRVDAAHGMIIASRHSLDTIAAETGFADRERMRRAFLRIHGRPPQDLRRASRDLAAA
ncbi:GlxA family transcriptional regulator [Acuticoccus yangtzensis]|uniref:GlxA family transcriptional regulator n=1 Tax=Acuticoccus yangtzensis TaxID=1443441 RepID=UPI00094959F8|nr:GlxA family transcriptional regulator [Acuticoccus yangtzensis]